MVHYSPRLLHKSAAAVWVLATGVTLSDPYLRLPLPAPPSARFLPFATDGQTLTEQSGGLNAVGVDPKDGQAEMSPDMARRLGLTLGVGESPTVHAVF